MKNVILLHGCCSKEEYLSDDYPTGSNSHWFPWSQKQLNKNEIESQTPEMPTPYTPKYAEWKRVMDQFHVNEETILVGHSCSTGFLIRYLADMKLKANKLILVAPWLDPFKKRGGFLDFHIDPMVQNQVQEMHMLYSTDETDKGVNESVKIIADTFSKIQTHKFNDKGHFTLKGMKTDKFPELIDLILN